MNSDLVLNQSNTAHPYISTVCILMGTVAGTHGMAWGILSGKAFTITGRNKWLWYASTTKLLCK